MENDITTNIDKEYLQKALEQFGLTFESFVDSCKKIIQTVIEQLENIGDLIAKITREIKDFYFEKEPTERPQKKLCKPYNYIENKKLNVYHCRNYKNLGRVRP